MIGNHRMLVNELWPSHRSAGAAGGTAEPNKDAE